MGEEKPRVPKRHRVFLAASTPFILDKGFDMAREHLFLAVHETISHMGWLPYSIGGIVVLISGGGIVIMRKKRLEAKNEPAE